MELYNKHSNQEVPFLEGIIIDTWGDSSKSIIEIKLKNNPITFILKKTMAGLSNGKKVRLYVEHNLESLSNKKPVGCVGIEVFDRKGISKYRESVGSPYEFR